MEDLARNAAKCGNTPGFYRIWFADIDEVSLISVTNVLRLVSFNVGGGWGNIAAKNISLSDVYNNGAHDIEISCSYHGVPEQVDRRLHFLAARRYIVRLKDRNQAMWLAGNFDTPLHFSYERIGDPDPTGKSEYRITFRVSASEPVYPTV